MEITLASGSPRRQQMLKDLGVQFKISVPGIVEKRMRGEPALHYVKRLAQQKAAAVASLKQGSRWAVLAADTIVISGNRVLEKPTSQDDAFKMLTRLSGSVHEVVTAYCWIGRKDDHVKVSVDAVKTKVKIAKRSARFWRWYVSTGEPMDKAGAYAAQGLGAAFVERVNGSFTNVVGLPLSHVMNEFESLFGECLAECSKSTRSS